jgi:hypothetical protein
MQTRAYALNGELLALAKKNNVEVVLQPKAWYGWDPIHHRRHLRPLIWRTILDSWRVNRADSMPGTESGESSERKYSDSLRSYRGPKLSWWSWWRECWPELQTYRGEQQQHAQPAVVLRDGTQISLY